MSVYDAEQLNLRDIEIYHCNSCGHTQIPAQINEEYYQDDYFMGSYWGTSFKRVREQQIERLTKLVPNTSRFLDIGCGVGHYLELAGTKFSEVYGIEPSGSSAKAAQAKGFTVVNDYFHDEIKFEAGFDAISLIEVLEHIEQPASLLEQAAGYLNENGILLVEVPNGQRIVEERLYYNLCTDHIQYFSITSLTTMAYRAGLSVICVQEAANPNLLELYARKVTRTERTFSSSRDIALNRLLSQISNDSKLAAWGAGAESACFLAMLEGKAEISCVFDSDQAKHEHTIARIPIKKPTTELVHQFDSIILFANSHKQQIQDQLSQLGYKGKVLTFM